MLVRSIMRASGIAVASILVSTATLACPLVAEARPFTAGVGIGSFEAEHDWDGEADGTLQVFGRLGLTARVSAQLELQKIETNTTAQVRTGTALLVAELGQSGRLVPTMFAGLGLDHGSYDYASESGTHIEGGFGLEYRFDGGLVISGDIRMGGRSVEQGEEPVILGGGDALALYAPLLVEGKYRSARVGVGIRF